MAAHACRDIGGSLAAMLRQRQDRSDGWGGADACIPVTFRPVGGLGFLCRNGPLSGDCTEAAVHQIGLEVRFSGVSAHRARAMTSRKPLRDRGEEISSIS